MDNEFYEVNRKITRETIRNWMIEAWKNVKSESIRKLFDHIYKQ